MDKPKSRLRKISLFLTDEDFARARKKLPRFKPYDFHALMNEAKHRNPADPDAAFKAALQERTAKQLTKLATALKVDTSQPDSWMVAFLRLAFFDRGVGHVALSRYRSLVRKMGKWSAADDAVLLHAVENETKKGLSVRQAIRKIAADPERRRQLPYREQRRQDNANEEIRIAAALRAHYYKIKNRTPTDFLARALGLDTVLTSRVEGLQSVTSTSERAGSVW